MKFNILTWTSLILVTSSTVKFKILIYGIFKDSIINFWAKELIFWIFIVSTCPKIYAVRQIFIFFAYLLPDKKKLISVQLGKYFNFTKGRGLKLCHLVALTIWNLHTKSLPTIIHGTVKKVFVCGCWLWWWLTLCASGYRIMEISRGGVLRTHSYLLAFQAFCMPPSVNVDPYID